MTQIIKSSTGTIVEEILKESQRIEFEVKIFSGKFQPGKVDESRIAGLKTVGNYALAVWEHGGIDTFHELFLINVQERVAGHIKHHKVKTPAMYFGDIEIIDLKETDGKVLIKYKISANVRGTEEEFEECYTLHAKKNEEKVGERAVPDLQKVE